MRGVLLVVRARIFGPRPLSGEPRPFAYAFNRVASAIDQSISKIYAKMSETKSLLTTILVREGVLLVHNRDFLVLEQRDRDFRHIGGVVLGERGVRPNQTNYPWIRHCSTYIT